MRKIIRCIAIVLLIISCSDKKKPVFLKDVKDANEKQTLIASENTTLEDWIIYYQTDIDSFFTLEKFELYSEIQLNKIKGTIYGVYDEMFDETYRNFLIYSPDKKRYIDIDSYQWSLDKNRKDLLFEPDQEINLVDIPNETVWRIAFLGPSYWVEDAFWENDSIVFLLENSYDKMPSITQINLNSEKMIKFKYQDSLKIHSEYTKHRILNKINYNEKNLLPQDL